MQPVNGYTTMGLMLSETHKRENQITRLHFIKTNSTAHYIA